MIFHKSFLTLIHDKLNICHFIVQVQQVVEARAKRKIRDSKRARSFDGSPFKGKN